MKEPKCSICSGPHYKTFCFQAPKKALKKKPIKVSPKPSKPLKRAYIKPKSTKNARKVLIYELDRIFSLYIRLKDSIRGMARCVTCGSVRHYKEMQNGHFIPRGKFATRWDEMNCHVQCPECNEGLNGNLVQYRRYMNMKYGVQAVQDLQLKSVIGEKITTPQIREMITYYRDKVKSLTF